MSTTWQQCACGHHQYEHQARLNLTNLERGPCLDLGCSCRRFKWDQPATTITRCPSCGKAYPNDDPICPVCD